MSEPNEAEYHSEIGVPLTGVPEGDKFPHYYEGEVDGGIESTVVHAENVDLDSGVIGVGFIDGQVFITIDGKSDLTSMGMSLVLSPQQARKAARSMLHSAYIAEGGED